MIEPEKPIEHHPLSVDDFDDIDDEGMYDSVQKVHHEPKRFNASVAELKQQRPEITHKQAQKLVSQYYHSN